MKWLLKEIDDLYKSKPNGDYTESELRRVVALVMKMLRRNEYKRLIFIRGERGDRAETRYMFCCELGSKLGWLEAKMREKGITSTKKDAYAEKNFRRFMAYGEAYRQKSGGQPTI